MATTVVRIFGCTVVTLVCGTWGVLMALLAGLLMLTIILAPVGAIVGVLAGGCFAIAIHVWDTEK
jgi:hypothetical protein